MDTDETLRALRDVLSALKTIESVGTSDGDKALLDAEVALRHAIAERKKTGPQ